MNHTKVVVDCKPEKDRLIASAEEWEKLANEQPDDPCGRNRKQTYLAAGKALRMQAADGIARCVCCLKPY